MFVHATNVEQIHWFVSRINIDDDADDDDGQAYYDALQLTTRTRLRRQLTNNHYQSPSGVEEREREKERKSNITLNPFGRQQNSDDRHFFFFFLSFSLSLSRLLCTLDDRCSFSRNHTKKRKKQNDKEMKSY